MRVHARVLCGPVLLCVVEGDLFDEGQGALLVPVRAVPGSDEGRLVGRLRERVEGLAWTPERGASARFNVALPWGAVAETPARTAAGGFDATVLEKDLKGLSWAGFQDVGVPVLGKSPARAEALTSSVLEALAALDPSRNLLSTVSLWTDSPEKAALVTDLLRKRVRAGSVRTPPGLGMELVRWWLNFVDALEDPHCATLNVPGYLPFLLSRGFQCVDGHGEPQFLRALDHVGRACDLPASGDVPARPAWEDLGAMYRSAGGLDAPLRHLGARPDRLERSIVPRDRGARARAFDLLVRMGRRWGGDFSARIVSLGGGSAGLYYVLGGVRIACTSYYLCDRASHLQPVPDGAPDALLVGALEAPADWNQPSASS